MNIATLSQSVETVSDDLTATLLMLLPRVLITLSRSLAAPAAFTFQAIKRGRRNFVVATDNFS
jgi:hypothetical protein